MAEMYTSNRANEGKGGSGDANEDDGAKNLLKQEKKGKKKEE